MTERLVHLPLPDSQDDEGGVLCPSWWDLDVGEVQADLPAGLVRIADGTAMTADAAEKVAAALLAAAAAVRRLDLPPRVPRFESDLQTLTGQCEWEQEVWAVRYTSGSFALCRNINDAHKLQAWAKRGSKVVHQTVTIRIDSDGWSKS